jgi:hypothetical protein
MTPDSTDAAQWLPWMIPLLFYGAPLLHVALAPSGGGWRPPPGSGCPFGPRLGWLVIVLLLGPVGWLLFVLRRRPTTIAR